MIISISKLLFLFALYAYYSVLLYKINNHIFHLLPPKNILEIFLFPKDWKPKTSVKSIGEMMDICVV